MNEMQVPFGTDEQRGDTDADALKVIVVRVAHWIMNIAFRSDFQTDLLQNYYDDV